MINLASAVAELLFPSFCLSCNRLLPGKQSFCAGCRSEIRFIGSPACPSCCAPFPVSDAPDHYCGNCIQHPLPNFRVRSLGIYDTVLMQSIHAFKYGGNLLIGEHLGRMMAEFRFPLFDCGDYSLILPVPLHTRRLRRRGFNQSVILARPISRAYGIPLDFRVLTRVIDTESQTGLKRNERRSNIRKAFRISRPERIHGQHILLVDDVYTTGSTLSECAKVLLKAGAASVGAVTLARAIQELS